VVARMPTSTFAFGEPAVEFLHNAVELSFS
jgi:hypothetical protein